MAATDNLDRRSFIRMAATGAGLALFVPVLAACGSAAPAPATAGASVSAKPASAAASAAPSSGGSPAASVAANAGASPLPSYIPQANGPKPDFPAAGPLYEDGFMFYPKNPPKLTTGPVGLGSKVQMYTNAGAPIPPTPVDKNLAWQEVNKQLNADMQFTIISQADYTVKFATLMAGNDLPDIASVSTINPPPSLTQFLQQSAADLTPFLAGDAAKDYPNLAAIPTNTWRNSGAARGGKLWMLPIQRYPTGRTLWRSKDVWNTEIGPDYTPKNADDFKRVLQVLNKPSTGRYAMGGYKGQAYYFPFFAAMFGAPNGWSVANGKLTKDLETPQYKEAAGYLRDLVSSQLFHPDALTIPDPNTARGNFLAGKIALIVELFGVGWQDAWTRGLKQNPVFIPAPVLPFAAHDGGKAQHYLSAGVNGLTMFKKAAPERVKELLRIANYCAAPFGSAEDLLLTTGVQGTDYTLDSDGRPVPTPASNADANSVPWKYVVQHPQVAWLTGVPDYAKAATDFEKVAIPLGVQDPSYGFFSALNDAKGGVLSQAFVDGLTDILAGRSPLTGFDQLVKDWQTNGGNQIRTELEAAIAAGQ